MPYNNDMDFTDFSSVLGTASRNLLNSDHNGLLAYKKWQRFLAGRSHADVAIAEGREETEIAEMDAAFAVFNASNNFLNNVAVSQADHMYSLLPFV